MFAYDHFGVEFDYETRIELCGTVHNFVGHVYLTARWNGDWDLDSVSGILIEDPDNAALEFSLTQNPQTAKAIKKWLLQNTAFIDTANDKVRYHD